MLEASTRTFGSKPSTSWFVFTLFLASIDFILLFGQLSTRA